MPKSIAIVEDDRDQRENYADALRSHGYVVDLYANRSVAQAGFKRKLPDLAILDIMLENEIDGGFDLCRELRNMSPKLPIIFLTARDSDIDRVSGLRLDAWDYLTKPVSLQFLAVRVSSLFRIAESVRSTDLADDIIQLAELTLDPGRMLIEWRAEPLSLTLTEFWLVEALVRRPGQVKVYDTLMKVTRQSYVEKNTINGYIRRIRKKFKEVDATFNSIETVFAIGYRWKV